MKRKKEFLKEFRELLEKHHVYIAFSVWRDSDCHEIYDEKMLIVDEKTRKVLVYLLESPHTLPLTSIPEIRYSLDVIYNNCDPNPPPPPRSAPRFGASGLPVERFTSPIHSPFPHADS
jgi:hypothetical protein